MTHGLVLEDVERLTVVDPSSVPGEVDPRYVADINEIGAAVEHDEPPPVHLSVDAVIRAALRDTVGSNRHSKDYLNLIEGRQPLAEIKGFGIARGQNSPGNGFRTDVLVEQKSRSMVIASGDELGVRATTLAFERKVRTARAGLIDAEAAGIVVMDALHDTAPRVARTVRERLGADSDAAEVNGLGVQIVDNKIVHYGRQPLLVLNAKTGEVAHLTYNAAAERGVHTLDPGRYIVMMCGGADPELINTDTNTLARILQEACAQRIETTPEHLLDTEEDRAQAKAELVAAQVQAALGGSKQDVTVVAAAVEVAQEWYDARSGPRRATDYGRLATFLTMTAAKFFDPTVRDLHRREVYERMKSAGAWGKAGRSALLLADAGVATGVAFTAMRFAAPELTHHLSASLGQQIGHAGHWLGWPGAEHAAASQVSHTGTNLTDNHPAAPLANDALKPGQLDAANQQPAAPAQFADTYTAHAHDPANGNGPSTISSMARQSFDFYGGQYHLPADEIARLKQTGVDGAIDAFRGDTTNHNNGTVNNYSERWVMNGTTYSLEAMNKEVSGVVAADAHRLGLDAPQTATQPEAVAATAPATQPTTGTHAPAVAAAPITPEHTSQIEQLATPRNLVIAGSVVAAGTTAWLGVAKLKSWVRNNRHDKAATLPSGTQARLQKPSADMSDDQESPLHAPSAYHESPQTAQEASPEHKPRHLSSATTVHTPLHLDPTDPDADPESSLLGLDPVDMPVVPGLNLAPVVPRSPRYPFAPEDVDTRPAYVNAAYHAFRDPDDAAKQAHWQAFTDGHELVEPRKPNFLRRLFSRRRQTQPRPPVPSLAELERFQIPDYVPDEIKEPIAA